MTRDPSRWTERQAADWYDRQPWLVGANYVPATAVNQLEMWQAETFDPARIDLELGWARGLGMNTMRVFLHDLLWQQDCFGLVWRVNTFLAIAARHHIRPMFVLFDSCWDPFPKLGPQRAPVPGVHNSAWVRGPDIEALSDPTQRPRLREYVRGIVGEFGDDERVLAWDVWNEPGNGSMGDYGWGSDSDLVLPLLPEVFSWVRDACPAQPLTSGVWHGDWSTPETLRPLERAQLDLSDVVSFHDYGWPEDFGRKIDHLGRYGRPILCTEYMARGAGSTFDTILPIAKRHRVAAINWGLVDGKTQTRLPWDSWHRPYVDAGPVVWHHEVFHGDGRPYREREAELFRELTAG